MNRLYDHKQLAEYLSLSEIALEEIYPSLKLTAFPDPLRVFNRWDIKAVDRWLDYQSEIPSTLNRHPHWPQRVEVDRHNRCPPETSLETFDSEQATTAYTVKDIMLDYLDWFRVHRKSYVTTQYQVNRYIIPEFGETIASELTTEAIRTWHESYASTPRRVRSPKGAPAQVSSFPMDENSIRQRKNTANRCLGMLKAGLNRAFRDGKLPTDIAWRRVKCFPGVRVANDRFLTIPECQELVASCAPDFKLLVKAALFTGARFSELKKMRKPHFRYANANILIPTSKTGKSRRISLSPEANEFFKFCVSKLEFNDHIFTRHDGAPWSQTGTYPRLRDGCQIAGIEPPITFHQLRHTYASLLVMSGVPMVVVARNLGHASTEPCEKHYAHLAPNYISDTIEKGMPELFISQSE